MSTPAVMVCPVLLVNLLLHAGATTMSLAQAIPSSISYGVLSVMIVIFYLRETRLPWASLEPEPGDFCPYARILRGLGHRRPTLQSVSTSVAE